MFLDILNLEQILFQLQLGLAEVIPLFFLLILFKFSKVPNIYICKLLSIIGVQSRPPFIQQP